MNAKLLLVLLFKLSLSTSEEAPSWEDLDRRPLPRWYDEAKFGILVCWGLYSVPGFLSPWFQSYWQGHWEGPYGSWRDYDAFLNKTERSNFAYADYAHRFLAELYRPEEWAEVFAKAGAQYVVLTSKHHEGFCMWNSTTIPTTWNWNVVDVGPRRDLLGDLASEVKSVNSPQTGKRLRFGAYHSLLEFFNPLYAQDRKNNWTTSTFVDMKTLPELYDLVERYEPDILWSDGQWEAPSRYWKSRKFLSWYAYNSSVAEAAVWNDRWGSDTTCMHGSFLNCEDRRLPDEVKSKKWEDVTNFDMSSWSYNRNHTAVDFLTPTEIIHMLIKVVAYNGNLLLNVAPSGDGTINPIYVDRLMSIGEWLTVNGEGIYGTKPWKVCQNETLSSVFYTSKVKRLYAHVTKWPEGNFLELRCPVPTTDTTVHMLGLHQKGVELAELEWIEIQDQLGGLSVQLPSLTPDIIPCQHSWVLVISGLANL